MPASPSPFYALKTISSLPTATRDHLNHLYRLFVAGSNDVFYVCRQTAAAGYEWIEWGNDTAGFDEAAQDAVGTILVDGTGIDFTYADGTPSITAEPIFAGTGAAGTVARSDHDHDSAYFNVSGDTVSGTLTTSGNRVATPSSAQTIDAAGDTILANAEHVEVTNTTGGSITLTSAPTIADGTNGQVLEIMSVGTQDVVIQDQGSLASSNLRLTGASITLSPRDSVRLRYSSTVGDWVQVGTLVAVL